MIGLWAVKKEFKDDFMRLLQPAIVSVRKFAEASANASAAAKWKTPTPAQHVQQFLEQLAWSQTRLIEKLADTLPDYEDPLQAAKKQLRVITKTPKAPNVLKDYHVSLCQVMKENSPACKDLTPLDLCWRRA